MGLTTRLDQWTQAHQWRWLVVPRVALGIMLFIKGISFITHADTLTAMINGSRFAGWETFLSSYIIFAHLFGGAMIIIGLITRIAVLMQLPILLGAIMFFNTSGVFALQSELWFSVVVLLLLIVFLIEGGGPYSMDRYMQRHEL